MGPGKYNLLNDQFEAAKKELTAKGEDASLVQTAQDLNIDPNETGFVSQVGVSLAYTPMITSFSGELQTLGQRPRQQRFPDTSDGNRDERRAVISRCPHRGHRMPGYKAATP